MIKKLLASSILLGILIVPLYPVYAVDDEPDNQTQVRTKNTATTPAKLKVPKIDDRLKKMGDKQASMGGVQSERRQKIASMTATLKERLGLFKDKNKAQRVERINAELVKVNEKRTTALKRNIDNIAKILAKLEERVSSNSASSNTSDVQGAIMAAKTQINTAQSAVVVQADKDYIIQISSESGVKNDAKKSRDELHNDLKTVQDQVKSAREAVRNVIRTVAEVLGGAN